MQIGHSSCGGSFSRGPTSFSVPRSSLPPRLSRIFLISRHSFLCSLRCLFWHFLSQYQTHLHPPHCLRVSLFSPQAEQNLVVGVFCILVPFFVAGSTFLPTDWQSDIEPSCSAAANVPSCLVVAIMVVFCFEEYGQYPSVQGSLLNDDMDGVMCSFSRKKRPVPRGIGNKVKVRDAVRATWREGHCFVVSEQLRKRFDARPALHVKDHVLQETNVRYVHPSLFVRSRSSFTCIFRVPVSDPTSPSTSTWCSASQSTSLLLFGSLRTGPFVLSYISFSKPAFRKKTSCHIHLA